ncbi:PadR family transcriptional regulator [Ruminococcaceae bacterium OttesenSCG-928-D13]|nr:PadR family transcriptional regulator [Ruminococcaceae bacterium OttesenSCG-928-D13]
MSYIARKSAIESKQLTDTIYYILLCLSTPLHGYALMSQIEKMTDGELVIGPGSMYTTLKKLLDAGLISMVDRETKTYLITLAGKKSLLDDYERRKKIVDQSSAIIKGLEV